MKNVLFINGHLNVGGCERSLVDVLKNIDYKKYNVDLLLLEELGDYQNEVPKQVNICLYSLNDSFGSFFECMKNAIKKRDFFSIIFRVCWLISKKLNIKALKYTKSMFRGLKKTYDVVVAYRPGICTELAAYVFDGNKKISWWHHGEMNFDGESRKELYLSYLHMNNIIAVSNSSSEIIKKTFPDLSDRIRVISNMICKEELILKSQEQKLIIDPEQINLVSVGRLSPEKNFLLCPHIGKRLKEKNIPFKWYIVGDGVEYDVLKNLITEFQLNEEFVLTGRLENPYSLIKDAYLLIHPSLVESQGLTILESMALNTPVIVVKSSGAKEFIINEENGYLLNGNSQIIADTIKELIYDRKKYSKIKSHTICPERYMPPKVICEIEKLLDEE